MWVVRVLLMPRPQADITAVAGPEDLEVTRALVGEPAIFALVPT